MCNLLALLCFGSTFICAPKPFFFNFFKIALDGLDGCTYRRLWEHAMEYEGPTAACAWRRSYACVEDSIKGKHEGMDEHMKKLFWKQLIDVPQMEIYKLDRKRKGNREDILMGGEKLGREMGHFYSYDLPRQCFLACFQAQANCFQPLA